MTQNSSQPQQTLPKEWSDNPQVMMVLQTHVTWMTQELTRLVVSAIREERENAFRYLERVSTDDSTSDSKVRNILAQVTAYDKVIALLSNREQLIKHILCQQKTQVGQVAAPTQLRTAVVEAQQRRQVAAEQVKAAKAQQP